MLKALGLGLRTTGGMGAVRPDAHRSKGRKAGLLSARSDATIGVRIGEEGSPQHGDDQEDEREDDCIVHDSQ